MKEQGLWKPRKLGRSDERARSAEDHPLNEL
jgi:hypothetical protein